jgi:hypothetical protein
VATTPRPNSCASALGAPKQGDGWFGWNLNVNESRGYVERLRTLRQRGQLPLEITVVPDTALSRAAIADDERAGVDRLVLVPDRFTGDATDALIAGLSRWL